MFNVLVSLVGWGRRPVALRKKNTDDDKPADKDGENKQPTDNQMVKNQASSRQKPKRQKKKSTASNDPGKEDAWGTTNQGGVPTTDGTASTAEGSVDGQSATVAKKKRTRQSASSVVVATAAVIDSEGTSTTNQGGVRGGRRLEETCHETDGRRIESWPPIAQIQQQKQQRHH
jgi:hypothetical protein